jgi:hypothetical protein
MTPRLQHHEVIMRAFEDMVICPDTSFGEIANVVAAVCVRRALRWRVLIFSTLPLPGEPGEAGRGPALCAMQRVVWDALVARENPELDADSYFVERAVMGDVSARTIVDMRSDQSNVFCAGLSPSASLLPSNPVPSFLQATSSCLTLVPWNVFVSIVDNRVVVYCVLWLVQRPHMRGPMSAVMYPCLHGEKLSSAWLLWNIGRHDELCRCVPWAGGPVPRVSCNHGASV